MNPVNENNCTRRGFPFLLWSEGLLHFQCLWSLFLSITKILLATYHGPVKRLDAKETKGVMLDSTCWTELVPEENRTDAEAPTYSFRCEAGHFECSVSGLRWVCSEKVIFKYRFCSWDGHMERIESRGYMPAGPMMDITLITGKMMEVFLPHWICTDDIPKPLDWFAVLHMDDCGDAVENVSEVSSAHVKLSEPIFSPRAVLMKVGLPVKISCNVLIYQTNTAFLTLHVYLIPRDPGLQQKMDLEETYNGYKVIRKPDPEKSLKIKDYFILTSDLGAAEVSPKTGIKLRYPRGEPNFFEVYVENANRNFSLMLRPDGEDQPVWECAVRKDEYQSSGQAQEKQRSDEHLSAMMQRAAAITSDKEMLLKLLNDLKQHELKDFKWQLKNRDESSGIPSIPASLLDEADTSDLVDLMMKTFTQQAVEVTKDIFKKINRNDLVERLPDTRS
ncbi:NACHT, LRR and PYD domains-containing protein 1 homolog [Fundulus heteroclitus]|uniref:NACHT, LRR and PYD domains-containing protein 1 homolog n=1 Tax=Fundulus heteroclitus TaxID=8078 RepID=UPI00165AE268|nr:NACHT, LRR and PYD domains-containing protein 1 homolog [Fundulus heteroclitus]